MDPKGMSMLHPCLGDYLKRFHLLSPIFTMTVSGLSCGECPVGISAGEDQILVGGQK